MLLSSVIGTREREKRIPTLLSTVDSNELCKMYIVLVLLSSVDSNELYKKEESVNSAIFHR